MDPGLAALVAAILSGSVGAYGYSQDARTSEQKIEEQVESKYAKQLEEARKDQGARDILETTKKRLGELETELKLLKEKNMSLESSASAITKSNETFKNATADVLKAAIPTVIRNLSSKYTWIQPDGSNVPKTMKALEYPATYTGRLARMSLYDFYQKRVLKALEEDKNPKKGGRRRYRRSARRGGTDTGQQIAQKVATLSEYAPVVSEDDQAKLESLLKEDDEPAVAPSPPIPVAPVVATTTLPTYEEFALEYTKAIEEATASMPTVRQAYNDRLVAQREGIAQGKRTGDDIVAKRARDTIVPQLDAAIKAGDEALALPVPASKEDELKPLKRALGEKLDVARELAGNPQPGESFKKSTFGRFSGLFQRGGASNLREVETAAEWSELNTPKSAKDVLDELKTATKEYKNAVDKATKGATKEASKELSSASKGVRELVKSAKNEVSSRQKTIGDIYGFFLNEIARMPVRVPPVNLMGVKNDLVDNPDSASKTLDGFVKSDTYQSFIDSESLFEKKTTDPASVQAEFDTLKKAYEDASAPVYERVDRALKEASEIAKANQKAAPDFTKKVFERLGLPLPVAPAPVVAEPAPEPAPEPAVAEPAPAPEPPKEEFKKMNPFAATDALRNAQQRVGVPGLKPTDLYPPNPLRGIRKGESMRNKQLSIFASTGRFTQKKTPKRSKGGKARKRTLKKRRGGK